MLEGCFDTNSKGILGVFFKPGKELMFPEGINGEISKAISGGTFEETVLKFADKVS